MNKQKEKRSRNDIRNRYRLRNLLIPTIRNSIKTLTGSHNIQFLYLDNKNLYKYIKFINTLYW